MKAVLISIRPQWCELIARLAKTLEIRKNKPTLETPFKCYIYCTKDGFKSIFLSKFLSHNRYVCNGKVIGEFLCDDCSQLSKAHYGYVEQHGCVSKAELKEYMGLGDSELEYSDGCYGWHISDLVIYDKPKELSEFRKPCGGDRYCESCRMFSEFPGQCCNKALVIKRPPQSWRYVEKLWEEAEREERR